MRALLSLLYYKCLITVVIIMVAFSLLLFLFVLLSYRVRVAMYESMIIDHFAKGTR